MIASADGYILTNHHVLEEEGETEVVLADGQRVRAVHGNVYGPWSPGPPRCT